MTNSTTRDSNIQRDNILLQKIKEQDKLATTTLYENCRSLISYFTLKYSGNRRIDFQDAYQEAILACYQNIKNGKLETLTVEFKDYLMQIMRFKIEDQLNALNPERRRRLQNEEFEDIQQVEHIIPITKKTHQIVDEDETEDNNRLKETNPFATGSYDYIRDKKEEIVTQVVRMLKEPCKTILELFYFKEMSYREMLGKVPGYSNEDGLKTKSYKCKKGMEDLLKEKLIENNIAINA